MRFSKISRLGAAALVIAALLAMATWPEAIEVDLAGVARGPMQVTIDEDGETRVRDRFVVSTPVAGQLQRIELEPGDRVARGTTVVARLAPSESPLLDPRAQAELNAAVAAARAAVGQAQAELNRIRATLDQARTTRERQRALAEAGAVSRETLEAAETTARSAENAARAAEFAVARAEYELQLARARVQAPSATGRLIDLTAPIDGVVLKRLHESATVVAPGEPLLEIGDPQNLEVIADLLSTDAVRVSPGNPVLIDRWGGPQPLEGTVRRVEPSGFMKISALGVEEQRVNVVIDFADPVSASRALGDGYRVEVRIVIWRDDDVLKVPVGSLFRRGDQWAVFVIDDDRARLRTVDVGQRNSDEAQILGGLDAGQTIVLHPPDTLTDGSRTTARAAAAP